MRSYILVLLLILAQPLYSTNADINDCKCVLRSRCRDKLEIVLDVVAVSPNPKCPDRGFVCCYNETKISSCGLKEGLNVQGFGKSISTASNEIPWMASIWKTGPNGAKKYVCGASLLSPNTVLTSASCVHNKDTPGLKIRIGEITKTKASAFQERSVLTVTKHPTYDPSTLSNDLAVIVTTESFDNIQPICTPMLFGSKYANPEYYNSSNCFATGWGKSSAGSKEVPSATLNIARLKVVHFDECQEKLQGTCLTKNFSLDSTFLCAKVEEGFGTCGGDEGNPLFCSSRTNSKEWIQIGVTSWGIGCGKGVPRVFASLKANHDWLSTVLPKAKKN